MERHPRLQGPSGSGMHYTEGSALSGLPPLCACVYRCIHTLVYCPSTLLGQTQTSKGLLCGQRQPSGNWGQDFVHGQGQGPLSDWDEAHLGQRSKVSQGFRFFLMTCLCSQVYPLPWAVFQDAAARPRLKVLLVSLCSWQKVGGGRWGPGLGR